MRANTSDTKLHSTTCLNYAHTIVLLMIKSMCRTNTRVFQYTNFIFLYSQDFLKATFLCVNLPRQYDSDYAANTVLHYSELYLLSFLVFKAGFVFNNYSHCPSNHFSFTPRNDFFVCITHHKRRTHTFIFCNTHHSSLILWNVLR